MQTPQECFGIPGRKNPPRSYVFIDTGNNYGSTSSRIRRFSGGTLDQKGSDIQYVDSSINGSSFTALTEGLYFCAYSSGTSGSTEGVGITVNEVLSATGATNIVSVTYAQGRRAYQTAVSALTGTASALLWLSAGDVVRPHGTAGDLNTDEVYFYMIKVSN